jgi:hypothetical protein
MYQDEEKSPSSESIEDISALGPNLSFSGTRMFSFLLLLDFIVVVDYTIHFKRMSTRLLLGPLHQQPRGNLYRHSSAGQLTLHQLAERAVVDTSSLASTPLLSPNSNSQERDVATQSSGTRLHSVYCFISFLFFFLFLFFSPFFFVLRILLVIFLCFLFSDLSGLCSHSSELASSLAQYPPEVSAAVASRQLNAYNHNLSESDNVNAFHPSTDHTALSSVVALDASAPAAAATTGHAVAVFAITRQLARATTNGVAADIATAASEVSAVIASPAHQPPPPESESESESGSESESECNNFAFSLTSSFPIAQNVRFF